MTQTCLNIYCTNFACKIGALADTYYKQLQIGGCSDVILFKLELAEALLEQICAIQVEDEICLSEQQICCIIDKLKLILTTNKCDCNCNES